MNWNDTSVRFWAILLPLLIWNIHITKPVRLNIAQRYLIWLKWAFIKWSTSKYQQFHHQFTAMWILYRVHSFTSGFSWDFSMEFTSEWRFTLTDILWYQNKLGHIIHLRNSKYYSALARELRRLLISRIAFLSCRKGFTVFYPLSCWQNNNNTTKQVQERSSTALTEESSHGCFQAAANSTDTSTPVQFTSGNTNTKPAACSTSRTGA